MINKANIKSYFKKELIIYIISFLSIVVNAQDVDSKINSGSNIIEIIDSINRPASLKRCEGVGLPSCSPENSEEKEWESSGFSNPKIRIYNMAPSLYKGVNITHKLKMTFVMFRNTGWSEERIQAQLLEATEIYKKCGIKFYDVKLVIADAPNGIVDISYKTRDDEKISRNTPSSKKPVVYFIRSNTEGQVAYAWDASVSPPLTNKFNTIWITDVIDKSYKKMHDPSYNVLAHEVGHVLCGCRHLNNGEHNLMADSVDLVNGYLNKYQCDDFKSSNLVEKIQ